MGGHQRGHGVRGEGQLGGKVGRGDLLQGDVVGGPWALWGERLGLWGESPGAVVVTRCDRSLRADYRGCMSSWVADSLAILEDPNPMPFFLFLFFLFFCFILFEILFLADAKGRWNKYKNSM